MGSCSMSSRNLCELGQNAKALPRKQTSLSSLGLLLMVGGVSLVLFLIKALSVFGCKGLCENKEYLFWRLELGCIFQFFLIL